MYCNLSAYTLKLSFLKAKTCKGHCLYSLHSSYATKYNSIVYQLQYRSIITSFSTSVHACCHAVFHVESSCGNKILHVTRHGISCGIYTRVYTTHVIYTARLLTVEASYTIHENNY